MFERPFGLNSLSSFFLHMKICRLFFFGCQSEGIQPLWIRSIHCHTADLAVNPIFFIFFVVAINALFNALTLVPSRL